MMKRYILTIITVCLLNLIGITLSGCGMNGPLYLPDKDHPQPTSPDPDKPTWF